MGNDMPIILISTDLPVLHLVLGMFWILLIAPRIAANRDLVDWLNARYNNRSLRKLYLYSAGFLFWELYWLGLIFYTVGARHASLMPGKRAVKEQENVGDSKLGEKTRRPSADGPVSNGLPPSYQSFQV